MPRNTETRERQAKSVGVNIWADLLLDYAALSPGLERRMFGLELLPYIKPKLKSVDMTVTGGIIHTIHIGLIGE